MYGRRDFRNSETWVEAIVAKQRDEGSHRKNDLSSLLEDIVAKR
jgi:hypothetical protein